MWNIESSFSQKRFRRSKIFFDELQEDERIENSESFKVQVCYKVMEIMINQLTIRFESIRQLCRLFKCLSPTYLVASSNKDILEESKVLQSEYSSDISPSFEPQMLRFKVCFYDQLKEISSISQIAELLLIYTAASSSFSDIIAECFILPMTTATPERSFSKIKINQNIFQKQHVTTSS